VDGQAQAAILSNIHDNWGSATNWSYAFGYLSWTASPDSILPFVAQNGSNGTMMLQTTPLTYGITATIYVATIPQMFNFVFMATTALTGEKAMFFGKDSLIYSYPIAEDLCLPGLQSPGCYGPQDWWTNATLLRCDLMNASYSTSFLYTNGSQQVSVSTDESSTSDPITPRECFISPNATDFSSGGLQCSTNNTCLFTTAASRLLSYHGIAYAFNQLLLGSITMGGYRINDYTSFTSSKTPGVTYNSRIATTVLMDTEDLAFVTEFNGINETFSNLPMVVEGSNASEYRGISNKMATGTRGYLRRTLEQLFQNITISLLAEDYLQRTTPPNMLLRHSPT
jgi:hypothetical protein